MSDRPNVVYFHVDNLGYGELGCYGGGILRGADTRRIDQFAREGFRLLNFAPEAQCTPSRTALLTGRHAIRTGNHTVATAGGESGIVAWERTLGDLFSDAGYATMCLGKWHIGDCDGRWPTDHGFDTWYGPPHSYDECLWETDPWYVPGRDPVAHMLEGRKGAKVRDAEKLTFDLKRNVDTEYKRRAFRFMEEQAQAARPFFLYFNHSLMHIPVVPRDEYKGKSGHGDWADCLLQLDGDFGDLLDRLDALGLRDNTIVVFAGDNGNEEMLLHRGTGGFFEGSYCTGMEASLRTPCIARWPGRIAAGRTSNEIVHITDWFTTLLTMAGLPLPTDRVIDGRDQSRFLSGEQETSNREGFLYWNGEKLYGAKWQNFKLVLVEQKYLTDPALPLGLPRIVNLVTDPKEREPFNPVYLHTWTMAHFGRLMKEFAVSVQREPLVPAGAPLDFVPSGREADSRGGVIMKIATAMIAAAVLLASPAAHAQDDSAAELAKKLQNPVASLISVPFQSNWDFGIGPEKVMRYTLNVQPVIPISLGKDWNLITRTIVPFIHAESPVPGGDDHGGIGDIVQSFFFSPRDPVGGWILGAGPVFLYPSASDDALGAEKWGAGPTAVVLRQDRGFTYGLLANHLWSFAGEDSRQDISATFLQPFLSYTTRTHTTVGLNTESTYDWNNEQWTVPINLTVAQLLKLGGQPLQLQVGGRYYAERPTGGPDWGIRFTMTLLFPR